MLILSCNQKVKRAENKEKNIENIYKLDLEKEAWLTSGIIGLYPSIEKLYLKKNTSDVHGGMALAFSEKVNFTSYNFSSCGNDFFTRVNGKYEFFEKDKLSISVDSVTYSSGFSNWEKPTEYRNSKEIIYLIAKVSDSIILTKQYDNRLLKWYDLIQNY